MYIRFKPQEIRLSSQLRFSITTRAYNAISAYGADRLLAQLSSSPVLLIVEKALRNGGFSYQVHTAQGIYICAIPEDCNSIVVTGFKKSSLLDQSDAMRNGMCFVPLSGGIIVQVRLTVQQLFVDYVNGIVDYAKSQQGENCTPAVRQIFNELEFARQRQPESEIEGSQQNEEYVPSRGLQRLLSLSKQYSEMSMTLNEIRAHEAAQIVYHNIKSVIFDPRLHGTVYTFAAGQVDEQVYKRGVQVALRDNEDEEHVAELTDVVRDGSGEYLVNLLFVNPVDVERLPTSGALYIPFSTVIEQVQLDANNHIQEGESAAKYMDIVLGANSSRGFENDPHTQLMTSLAQRKYPPNSSQQQAIIKGLNARDALLVMGPPGTGKTTVILEWVKSFVAQGKRVLISSQNNKAVDNVLARLLEEPNVDIIRIGSEVKIQEELRPCMFMNKIKSLRENILDVSQSNLSTLDDLINNWSSLLELLEEYSNKHTYYKELRNEINHVVKALAEIYKDLVRINKEHSELEKSILENANKFASLDRKLKKHIHSGMFVKLIFGIPAFFWRNNSQRLREHMEDAQKKQETLIKDYRTRHQQADVLNVDLRQNRYPTLINARIECDEVYRKIQVKSVTPHSNPWDFFQSIHFSAETLSLDTLIPDIKRELNRCAELREVLKGWQHSVSESVNVSLNECVLESTNVVGATCIGVSSQRRFSDLKFDVTIIDEAGQIQIHNAFVPMSVSNRLLMLGDHKQIPPSADEELVQLCEENGISTTLLHKSLFEHMYEKLPEQNRILLDTQYRIPAEIADVISKWFYDGQYKSFSGRRNTLSPLPGLTSSPFLIIDTSAEQNRHEMPIYNAGCYNRLEANVICMLVGAMLKEHDPDDYSEFFQELGIISAYKAQVELIRQKIQPIVKNTASLQEVVATLDSFQGQERDVIIYSFTKSSILTPTRRRIGFLNELRRLNVAMTRSKKMLVLIGDMNFLSSCQHMDMDDDGNPVYEHSEKQFSDFIHLMLEHVEQGNGELITYQAFMQRIKSMQRS